MCATSNGDWSLEGSLEEGAALFYQAEAKRVKKKQSKLNKSSQVEWFTRTEFKHAFFCELRQDHESCYKSYYLAYTGVCGILLGERSRNSEPPKPELTQEIRAFADCLALKVRNVFILYHACGDGLHAWITL